VRRYQEAIEKGYKKALALEPDNAQYKKALDMAQVRNLNNPIPETRNNPIPEIIQYPKP